MAEIEPNPVYIQTESMVPSKPASEFVGFSMGGSINFLLLRILPVGSIVDTMLTEAQFQAQLGNPNPSTWILADGRNVAGSQYSQVTSHSLAPDLRGILIRGQAGVNPDGTLALGTYETDEFVSHNHNFNDPGHVHGFNQAVNFLTLYQSGPTLSAFDQSGFSGVGLALVNHSTGITFNSNGGNENRPRNVTVNRMIRIN